MIRFDHVNIRCSVRHVPRSRPMPDLLLELFPARPFARRAAGARTNRLMESCGREKATHA